LANTNTMRLDDPCVHELVELDDLGGKVLNPRTATVSSMLSNLLSWIGSGGEILHLGEMLDPAPGVIFGTHHFPEDPPVVAVKAPVLRLQSNWYYPRSDYNLVCGIVEFCRTNHLGKPRSAAVDQLLDEFRRRGDRKRPLDFGGGKMKSVALERLPAITAAVAIGKSNLADDARGLLAAVKVHFVM
jgi:hypothetical protein